MERLAVGIAQLNAHVGDVDGNVGRMDDTLAEALAAGVRLLVFPELMISGYPPEDLLLRPHFLDRCKAGLDHFASHVPDTITCLVGLPWLEDTDLYNALAVVHDRQVVGIYRKMHLPNYGVFDEQRYFARGIRPGVLRLDGVTVGLSICEDVWVPNTPVTTTALAGAQIVVNASASPYYRDKGSSRLRMLAQRAIDNGVTICYANLAGGQDTLVFDGQSIIVDHRGDIVARAQQFSPQLLIADLPTRAATAQRLRDPHNRALAGSDAHHLEPTPGLADGKGVELVADVRMQPAKVVVNASKPLVTPALDAEAEVYEALKLGVRDYVRKNGFEDVIFGLSGGVDSALVACIAADALGPEHVSCLVMPSTYSSDETQGDAEILAENLGIECHRVPIGSIMGDFDTALAPMFEGTEFGIAEENLQARIRFNLLGAMSNKFNKLILACSNKSEGSVGYATWGGDSMGGVLPIGDVPKMLVFRLIEWRNEQSGGTLIPERIITRPPSAELRPDQQDTDSLPPYPILDEIIRRYVEQDEAADQIIEETGFDSATVNRVVMLIRNSEFKRRQLGPIIKTTPRSYGRDWRLPLTNGYRPV